MGLMLKSRFQDKKLIVFDLDGTLTPSKSRMRRDVSRLLSKLLVLKKVAVIGGGRYEQFKDQFLSAFRSPKKDLRNLFLFPTTSTSFYRYKNGWKKVYEKKLSRRERRKIFRAFRHAFKEVGYKHPSRLYGRVIEDRGTQVTFSALGQEASVRVKEEWNRKYDVRPKLMRALKKYLLEFEVRRGGLTSIDVTKKGIDKAYGLRQIESHLGINRKDILFVGDALYPGGNDYAVRRTGVDCVSVAGPEDAKKVIRFLIRK